MTAARKFAAGLAEITSLAVFLGMIWLWAALLSGPHVWSRQESSTAGPCRRDRPRRRQGRGGI